MVENLSANAGDMGSIPGLGRSLGEENGNPLQYSCLGNPMDRGAWQPTVPGVTRVGHDLATKQHHHPARASKVSSVEGRLEADIIGKGGYNIHFIGT